MKTLAEHITDGATITTIADGTHVLADAEILHYGLLWFFLAGGTDQSAEHSLEYAGMQTDGVNLHFFDEDKQPVATIAPLEEDSEREQWQAWQEFLSTSEGQAMAAGIRRIKQAAIDWTK